MIRSSLLELLASPHFGVILVLIKVSIVFGLGFVLAYLLRNRSAAVRHFLWVTTLLGALTVPLVTRVVPQWEWPVISNSQTNNVNVSPGTPSSIVAAPMTREPMDISFEKAESAMGPMFSVMRIWLAGVLLVAIWFSIGHLALFRIALRGRPLTDPNWLGALENASRKCDLQRPVRLLLSPAIDSPMTWGHRRPIVLLPETALEWSPERRCAVLLHELAHVARKDFLVQFVASLTCALYWFHPGAWAAARRLRYESEHACDDRAIQSGTPAPDYASHLLSLALQSKARWPEAMAIGLTRPSTLESRVRAVLNEDLTRHPLSSRVHAGGWVTLGAFVLFLSTLTPVMAAFNDKVLDAPVVYEGSEGKAVEEEPRAPGSFQKTATQYVTVSPATDTSSRIVSRTLDVEPGRRAPSSAAGGR